MTMKCPACGKENADGTKFCKKCGAYLAWSSTAAGATSDFQPTVMVPDSVDPDSDATVIRPAARSAGRQIPASAPAEPDPLLEALADRSSPGPNPVRDENPAAPDTPGRSSKAGPIIAGLVSIVIIAAAAAYWFLGREPAPTTGRAAAVVPAAPPQPVVAPAPQVAPAPAQEAASAPAMTPAPAALPEPVPAPAPSPAPEPVAAPPVAPAAVAPASPPPPKARPKPAPAPKPAPVAAPPRAAAAPAPAAPAPAPVVVEPAPAAPAGPSSPAQACESKSFFAKPACMNEQCASPRFTSHPQCVELRERNRRRAEQEQRL